MITTPDLGKDSTLEQDTGAREMTGDEYRRPVVLSIAGFDPSSGAGVTADLKVFAAHGLYGMACITALTVQSTRGVRSVEPVSSATVAATLEVLAEDVTFAGIKIGMLATAEICAAVAEFLDSVPEVPVVLDPVLRSSSGRELLETAGIRLIQERLLGRANWITPNLEELSMLTGLKVVEVENVPLAAKQLLQMGQKVGNLHLNSLVTGGHLSRPDDFLLTSAAEPHWLRGQRVETSATHGTGCALSSALLCALIGGADGVAAATQAKEFVTEALRAAYPVGHGKGPMNHLCRLDRG